MYKTSCELDVFYEMKQYVPDREIWARYFDKKKEPGQITSLGWTPRIIGIGKVVSKKSTPQTQSVLIEAVTPVQRENERVEGELRRLGSMSTKKRKQQRGGGGGKRKSPRLKTVRQHDTSGF